MIRLVVCITLRILITACIIKIRLLAWFWRGRWLGLLRVFRILIRPVYLWRVEFDYRVYELTYLQAHFLLISCQISLDDVFKGVSYKSIVLGHEDDHF